MFIVHIKKRGSTFVPPLLMLFCLKYIPLRSQKHTEEILICSINIDHTTRTYSKIILSQENKKNKWILIMHKVLLKLKIKHPNLKIKYFTSTICNGTVLKGQRFLERMLYSVQYGGKFCEERCVERTLCERDVSCVYQCDAGPC